MRDFHDVSPEPIVYPGENNWKIQSALNWIKLTSVISQNSKK